jgi:hypothetical protein
MDDHGLDAALRGSVMKRRSVIARTISSERKALCDFQHHEARLQAIRRPRSGSPARSAVRDMLNRMTIRSSWLTAGANEPAQRGLLWRHPQWAFGDTGRGTSPPSSRTRWPGRRGLHRGRLARSAQASIWRIGDVEVQEPGAHDIIALLVDTSFSMAMDGR